MRRAEAHPLILEDQMRAGFAELRKLIAETTASLTARIDSLHQDNAAMRESIGELRGTLRTLMWVTAGLGTFGMIAKHFHWI